MSIVTNREQSSAVTTAIRRPRRVLIAGALFSVRLGILYFLLLTDPLAPGAQSETASATRWGDVAAKPLFRDPVHDGAADPVVVWNRAEQRWFMFYTNRRADATNDAIGVEWVHGTKRGIAESVDAGAAWKYRGTADIAHDESKTYWAPEIVLSAGTYHMFLTVVPGIFRDWAHPREIVHLTSTNLLNWGSESTLNLASDRVIDPCVLRLPDGTWRLWYNNERDKKSIYYADSPDLFTWHDQGKARGTSERGGEGPKVFRWKSHYWMAVDIWDGIRLYRSEDALNWQRQPEDLLKNPGKGKDDGVKGGHPDVIVSGDRAYLFYFTHPGRRGVDEHKDGFEQRRSSIQVVELEFKEGWISCDRDQPTRIALMPPP